VTADIATDPAWVRHRDAALAHGLRSCWSHPIVAKDGTLLGTFAMYHRKAREPYAREAAAVAEGATAAAIALQHWRAQDDLLETRERFQALTENAANIVIVTDMKGLIRFVSPAVTPILGRTPEEVLGQNAFSWLHPDDLPLAQTHFRQLRDEVGAQIQSTYRYRHKDGSWRLLEVIGKSRLNHAGEYLAVVSGRDVTEREDASQALRASQHQLNQALSEIKLLLEATDEGMVGLDSTGTIMFVNAAATRLLNLTAEELLGNSFDRLVRHTSEEGTDLIGHESLIVRCLLEGQRFRGSNELFWISETRSLPVEFSVSPVMADGKAQGAVLVFRDVSEKRALAQQLRFQALHDPLTGFSNRRGFEARLTQLIGSARTQGREHALCYVDLDHFKLVNDTCGHAAGDELLRQLPAVLQAVVRRHDTISRLGGDEFAILLEDCPLEQASRVAESVRDAVRNFRFVWQYRTFTIGASIGVVGITAESQGLVSVLGAADAACYVAKDQGPNHVHVSYPHDLAIIRRRGEMRWVARLKSALEEDQLRLHFQSIAALDGTPRPSLKHELLVRLVDARGELILPGAFQPAAERYQLMSSIDQWVVDHALRYLARDVVPHRHLHGHRFGINLSGESLRDGRVVESIEEGLKRHGVPPTMLYFEVTETAAIANLGAAVEFIRRLKALGCQLALDDFGIGMSSFSYLKHLPVDYLKIDGSFVKDMVNNPVDQAIVRSVHAVSRQMGIETIAEYAESAAILDCLRDIGINYAQGFAIARPRPLEEFAGLQEPVAASA